jgi:hypothetical protein
MVTAQGQADKWIIVMQTALPSAAIAFCLRAKHDNSNDLGESGTLKGWCKTE